MNIMNIFQSIIEYFKFLNLIDITFLVAIITLIILIVTLIYFIKINREVLYDIKHNEPVIINKEDDTFNSIVETKIENNIDNNVANNNIEKYGDEEGELLDLNSLTEKLKNATPESMTSVTEYEKDQEAKAIISYDELIKNKNKYAINYENEEVIDDLVVKKVNLNDLDNKNNIEVSIDEVKVISYAKEEAFLQALKELNNLLN